MDQESLDILRGLQAAQPTTQQVDYSGFMQDFQPVQNYPNYFVPQQGLLQNTPTLDTLSDLDVMQQRPQLVTNMLNQYPTLESDFQRSFAVSPDTFNMEVYKPLPYDADYWNSFATQAGGTTGGDDTLGAVIGGGLLATQLLGGGGLLSGDDDNDDGNDDGNDGTNGNGENVTGGGTTVSGTTGTGAIIIGSGNNNDEIDNTELDIKDDIKDGGSGTNGGSSTITGVSGNDTVDGSTNLDTKDSGSEYITQNDANDIIQSLIDSNDISLIDANSLIDTINNTSANFGTALLSGLSQISNVGNVTAATNLINKVQSSIGSSLANNQFSILDNAIGSSNAVNLDGSLITLDGKLSGLSPTGISTSGANSFNSYFDKATGEYFTQILDGNNNLVWTKEIGEGIKVGADGNLVNTNFQIVDDPRGIFDRIESGFTDFMNNPLNEGFGAAGSGLNDATSFTGGEALALGGGLLSALDAIEDGNVSNVFNAAAGIGASGILGGSAYGSAASAGATGAAAGAGAKGIQGLATNPATAIIGTALFIANQLDAPPSGKTGSGAFDYNTSTNTEFGMAGDKFKQSHVDQASAISQGIGTAINTIAGGYGLNVEGDHLVETGRERPLSLSFGDQESEQTSDNRLNYSAETGDITNSTDTMKRFYYTGTDGNDGTALANNVIKGTNLLSLKAIANGEDTINMQDFRLPARSESDVKNQYLLMGLDETAANALTSASQQATPETAGLLGGILYANTSNEDLFLTDTEKTSLLEKGYTEEQLDEILYG